MDLEKSDYLELLPEANPIILGLDSEDSKIFSLYNIHKSSQINQNESDDIYFNLQKDTKFQSLLLNYENLEDIFLSHKVLYDKYSSITTNSSKNHLSKSLKIGSEFNQTICNLQKLSQIRKNTSNSDQEQFQDKDIISEELIFDSDFESGNLSKVVRFNQCEYILFLQNDINSKGHTQWFYFRVRNGKNIGPRKFSIVNLSKHGYLYDCGMKISINSKSEQRGWFKGGDDILYKRNGLIKFQIDEQNQEIWYTLTFSYDFTTFDDEIYFAHSSPYTVTDLNIYLNKIELDVERRKFYHRSLLCRTLVGNRVEKLTITDPQNPESMKRSIVIMGRVHPGETVSSFIVQGFIQWLLSDNPQAQAIRQNYVVKIIPILNPDGVIHGNYRCSIAGCDLNRRWQNPLKELHPEIYFAKLMIMQLNKINKVSLLIDCHGHNTKRSIFMYGCNIQQRSKLNVHQNLQNIASKQFAYLMSQIDKNFSYKNSSFIMQKEKHSTARVTLFNDLKIPQIYTLESSFCGPEQFQYHFSTLDLLTMGQSIGICIFQYFFDKNTGKIVEHNDIMSLKPKRHKSSSSPSSEEIQKMMMYYTNLMQFGHGLDDNDTTNTQQDSLIISLDQKGYLQTLFAEKAKTMIDDGHESFGSTSQPSVDNLSPQKLRKILPKSLRDKSPSKKVNEKDKKVSKNEELILINESLKKPNLALKQTLIPSIIGGRYQQKQQLKIPELKFVELPVKIFDASWLVPNKTNHQEEKQQRLLRKLREIQNRRDQDILMIQKQSESRRLKLMPQLIPRGAKKNSNSVGLEQRFILIVDQSPKELHPFKVFDTYNQQKNTDRSHKHNLSEMNRDIGAEFDSHFPQLPQRFKDTSF